MGDMQFKGTPEEWDALVKRSKQKQALIEMMDEDDKTGLYKWQTAVEYLFQTLWDTPKDKLNWYAILKQAKAIEKEQIIDAYERGDKYKTEIPGEQYYNETYNK